MKNWVECFKDSGGVTKPTAIPHPGKFKKTSPRTDGSQVRAGDQALLRTLKSPGEILLGLPRLWAYYTATVFEVPHPGLHRLHTNANLLDNFLCLVPSLVQSKEMCCFLGHQRLIFAPNNCSTDPKARATCDLLEEGAMYNDT